MPQNHQQFDKQISPETRAIVRMYCIELKTGKQCQI
jgi:hypothetical protein